MSYSTAEVRTTCARAAAFLREARGEDLLWRDFEVLGLASTEWVTAFVMRCLDETDEDRRGLTGESADALVSLQHSDGGWGFDARWPSDCDSTAWACLALVPHGGDLEAARDYLGAHQDTTSGGFSTYAPADGVESMVGAATQAEVRGWCSSHPCVSAVAIQALAPGTCREDRERVRAAARYLTAAQASDGLWSGYWWSGATYTTYQALEGLEAAGELTSEQVEAALGALVDLQSASGAWLVDGARCPFETAFALRALMGHGGGADEQSVRAGIGWLRSNQLPDGSWSASPLLRMPSPELTQADLCRVGPPRRFADARRLFTTAAVVSVLDDFARFTPARGDSARPSVTPRRAPAKGVDQAQTEEAIRRAVRAQLALRLDERGLLLSPIELASAQLAEEQSGARLWGEACRRYAFPAAGEAIDRVQLETIVAFGAATGRVVAGTGAAEVVGSAVVGSDETMPRPSSDLLCGVFNLGISLVDRLCDESASTGERFLELVHAEDLAGAIEHPGRGSWLSDLLAEPFLSDAQVAWTVAVIEAVIAELHSVYPGEAHLSRRRLLSGQLVQALDVQRQTIHWSEHAEPERLIERSRSKSVLPFEIIQTLSGAASRPSVGTLLGEATWRVDDLVDLCRDGRSGSLNGVLLAAGDRCESDGRLHALERLLACDRIETAAKQAADCLRRG
ncbi:MAG TPA: prenyltransferase/squalene oxidase repeat-containing protein, partial [Solirubrobacteraceae bacterium]|nr:prenyltransferase/squalene oxidase repeat-containing protein [Solirubrobacteraceae bacterium]